MNQIKIDLKQILNIIFILFVAASFAPFFGVKVSPSYTFPIALGLAYVILSLLLIVTRKTFIKDFFNITFSKKLPLKNLVYFILYTFLITLIYLIFNITSISGVFLSVIWLFILHSFVLLFVAFYSAYKIFSIKTYAKIIFSLLYIVFLIGVVDFVAYYFNIVPIKNILPYFYIAECTAIHIPHQWGFIFPRVQSVYFEAGVYGTYMFFFLPIVYGLALSKYKLFKNPILNLILKKTIIPLMWFNLIFTQSPLWIPIGIIYTLIYFSKDILHILIKKSALVFGATGIAGVALMSFAALGKINLDISKTFLVRIQNVVSSLGSFQKFVDAENSLAVRITSWIAAIDIWKKFPLFGCGAGNYYNQTLSALKKTSMPLPAETMNYLFGSNEKIVFGGNAICNMLATYGIIGLILFCIFIFKAYMFTKTKIQYLDGLEKVFVLSLSYAFINIIINYFYGVQFHDVLGLFFIGTYMGLGYKIRKRLNDKSALEVNSNA